MKKLVSVRKQLTDIFLDQLSQDRRDFVLSIKRFGFWGKMKNPPTPLFIHLIDGREVHGGLADRFKGIISGFCIAQLKGFEFRIKHTFPFQLEDYLIPNTYEWRIKETDHVSCSIKETRLKHFKSLKLSNELQRIADLKADKQIHCYCQGELFKYIKKKNGGSFDFSEEFHKLFKPSVDLQKHITSCQEEIGGAYIAVVFRFQDLLGDFSEYQYKEASSERKIILINKCKDALVELKRNHPEMQILVTSDSQIFLKRILGMDKVHSFPSKVVHMDWVENAGYEVYLKSFLDFYLIAEAPKVYSVGTDEMYKTNFPNYAAQVNKIPFERILISG